MLVISIILPSQHYVLFTKHDTPLQPFRFLYLCAQFVTWAFFKSPVVINPTTRIPNSSAVRPSRKRCHVFQAEDRWQPGAAKF